nr:MAG TPA: hypothetical protein [Caudoviricetes sp.]DAY83664.1 MAG TPA: hypothetical protein [Caudoviricetes sp.]
MVYYKVYRASDRLFSFSAIRIPFWFHPLTPFLACQILMRFFDRQIHLPKMLICIQLSTYRTSPSEYFVM